MVSGRTHGPPSHRPPMPRRRFVPGQSARHSSSSLSSSDGSDEEHISKNGGGKYLHLVIPSNLHPGQEGNDCEERHRSEEEGSMARSGCTLDRFGDLGIDEEEDNAVDNGNHDVEEVENEEEEDDSAVEKEGKVNAEENGCARLDADVMYDDEGNRIEFMYDDEGNRVEKIGQEDDDIIWQDDEEEFEETVRKTTLSTRPREGLPPLAPPKVRDNRADIRERFNQTGQSWLRTKQLLNQQQEQTQSQEQDGCAELDSRRLYLSDSDSTEEVEVVEEKREHAVLPQIARKQPSEQRHVRFANVVDTRVFLAEEEDGVEVVGEDEEQEPLQTQPQRQEAASRMESMRMTLEDDDDDAQRVDVEEEDDESEVFNTRNFDEEDEDREDVNAEDNSVLDGEMIDFSYSRGSTVADNAEKPGIQVAVNASLQNQSAYGLKPPPRIQAAVVGTDEDEEEEVGGSFYFLDSPQNVSRRPADQVAEGQSRKRPERPLCSPKARAPQSKSSDLSDLYDGNVGDVGSILNDLQGIEVGKADTACVVADDDNIDGVEEVSSNAPVANGNSNKDIGRETSASPTERDCMKLNDDVLRSYQLMKEREEQQLNIELKDAATNHQREQPPAAEVPLTPPKLPKELQNPRYPYRHGHSLGDEVSDIFSQMSSLGPWAVSKKMEGYNTSAQQVISPKQHQDYQENTKVGAFRNSELNSSEENVLPPHQGWVRQDISLDDSMGDSLVGKMLTLVPSPRANPSMLSTPFDDDEVAENDDKPKRRRWPFGKKKKQKDDHAHTTSQEAVGREKKDYRRSTNHSYGRQSVHRENHVEERDSLEYYRYEYGEDEVGHRSDSFGNVRDEPQTLYDTDRCQTDENLEMHHGRVHGPEYYQRQVEENALQLHMAADNAALQLIQNEQQRRAKKQDMFRQEMEDRAREEEEALRQQEAAVLQAINSGNQDDLAAILSSNSQWAPDMTLGDASGNYARPSQQQAPSFLRSFVQGELCTSENAKFIEGKAKQIAEVLREAFEDDSASDISDYPEEEYRAKYAYA